MDKPILLLKEDFTNNIMNLISNSGLPTILVESTLQNILFDIKIMLVKQYYQQKQEYEEFIKSNKSEEATKEHSNEMPISSI